MSYPYMKTAKAIIDAHCDERCKLNRRSGQFLGQLLADEGPLSEKQIDWLSKLAVAAGVPTLEGGTA